MPELRSARVDSSRRPRPRLMPRMIRNWPHTTSIWPNSTGPSGNGSVQCDPAVHVPCLDHLVGLPGKLVDDAVARGADVVVDGGALAAELLGERLVRCSVLIEALSECSEMFL